MAQTTENQLMKQTDPYLEKFERFESEAAGKHPSWLFPIRKAGISRFAELGFPTQRDEDWRFTNVTPIMKLPFQPVFQYSRDGLTAESLGQLSFAGLDCSRLVFVNGHYSAELSSVQPQPGGIQVTNLASALAIDTGIIESHLGHYAHGENHAFAALNTAFFQDGAFIFAPKGAVVEKPVHLLFISTSDDAGSTSHPRNLVIAGPNSKLTVIESYIGRTNAPYFTNAVTEVIAEGNAKVEHCKFQDESLPAFHMAFLHAQLGKECNFISHSIATGARLSRNNIKVVLDAEGVECILNGLYVTKADQLADHHMIVEHAKPHCNSHEYYNGILDDRSKGVFHGRILVRPQAQKTDAKQTNKNLLLSDAATIDTKPQLEIYADDVKCTHGATIGQLDEDSIFYLRTRGIGAETARHMLIHAFAGEIIGRIRCAPVREELDQLIWDRLEQSERIAVPK
jgi:Fe-S cluster assembly protein SufD